MEAEQHNLAIASPTDSADVVELVPLDPRVRYLWWCTGALAVLQITAAVGLVLGVAARVADLPFSALTVTGVVAAAAAIVAAVVPVLRYRRWRYAVREQDLWIRQGVLWVTVSVIPYARLQFVDTRQGPLDRLFGLSQLVVHTAALGTSGRLPGLETTTAERLREQLAAVDPDTAGV